jgi:hypothetical protein
MTMRLLAFCILLTMGRIAHAQETYDVLTFTPPAGWAREDHPGSVLAFTQKDQRSGAWARIAIYKSTAGAGDLPSDFAAEWDVLVAKSLGTGPASRTADGPVHNGWSSKIGNAQFTFEKKPAFATLSTMSNGGRRLSIVVIANSEAFQKDVDRFLGSVRFDAQPVRAERPAERPAERSVAPPVVTPNGRAAPGDPNAPPSIIGRWSRSASSYPTSVNSYNAGSGGYVTSRYEFNSDGTYRYTQRTFFMDHPEILIVKEQGTFVLSGPNITVTPQRSVMEAYSKKNNSDELGTLTKTDRRTPEPVAYATTFNYSSGMKEWNLVLHANQPTLRDGRFDGGSLASNGWIFNQRFPGDDLTLPKGK